MRVCRKPLKTQRLHFLAPADHDVAGAAGAGPRDHQVVAPHEGKPDARVVGELLNLADARLRLDDRDAARPGDGRGAVSTSTSDPVPETAANDSPVRSPGLLVTQMVNVALLEGVTDTESNTTVRVFVLLLMVSGLKMDKMGVLVWAPVFELLATCGSSLSSSPFSLVMSAHPICSVTSWVVRVQRKEIGSAGFSMDNAVSVPRLEMVWTSCKLMKNL